MDRDIKMVRIAKFNKIWQALVRYSTMNYKRLNCDTSINQCTPFHRYKYQVLTICFLIFTFRSPIISEKLKSQKSLDC